MARAPRHQPQVTYAGAFDRLLFSGALPSSELQRVFFEPGNIDSLDSAASAVHASFFVVPHAVLALFWWRRPRALRPYVISALLTFYAGLVLFFLVPTAPPGSRPTRATFRTCTA